MLDNPNALVTQSKGAMLTRRKLLSLIPAPLLLTARHEQPVQQDPRVLPDQTAHVGVDMAEKPSRTVFAVFRLDPDGIYRMDDSGWVKLSEAL